MSEPFLKELSPLEQDISKVLEPILALNSLELIAIKLTGLKGKPNLLLYVNESSLDGLATISRLISDTLDVENANQNWFAGPYQLELSSPGLDRPLTKKSHFKSALGEQVKIKTDRQTLRGKLLSENEHGIQIDSHVEPIEWNSIRDACMIFTLSKSPKRR
ncbi:MAG: hypothetical protein I8H75_03570 [Myxococcaceae bacterium]|nr:hypothetical protein [Myxococcaceae bacterium]MBH2006407.1 hypothetical protein [Myxococcaceae bacterium]